MRIAAGGALAILIVMLVAASVLPSVGFAQRTTVSPGGSAAGLITVATAVGDHRQQLIVVDPETRGLAVYHIENASGEVSLKSVRNIHYDLRITEFNGTSPLPREIRSLLEPN
jgi:hypothetical protein